MTFWSYIAGPLIGAAIGYCTNYLAVKMLFYPRREIRFLGHRLPFTPGAIPRGKPRLAKAIGGIVGSSLLTKEDLTRQLLAEETQEKIVERAAGFLEQDLKQEFLVLTDGEWGRYEALKEKLSSMLCREILDSVSKMDLGEIIAKEGGKILGEKVRGTMLEMFLSEELVKSITDPIGEEIQTFLCANGSTYLQPVLDCKIQSLEEMPAAELLEKLGAAKDAQRDFIRSLYRKGIREGMDALKEKLNVSAIIEDKVNSMEVGELEELVLGVMKKELDTIVGLGALIGLLLGMLNIFF